MFDVFNTLARLPGIRFVCGTLLNTAGTPTLSQLSGLDVDQSMVSVVDTGVGDFNILVKNFKGDNGYAIGLATGTTISNMISCTAQTYSGDDATFTFKVEDDASTATDAGFNFILVAF